jgi:hypothetical protein
VPPCIATSPMVCRSRGDCRCGAGVGADPVLPVVASIATARRMKADGHTDRDIAKYLGVSRATRYLHRYLAEDTAA